MMPHHGLDHHTNSRIYNDQLRFALVTKEATMERKQFGNMKWSHKPITVNGKSQVYNPKTLSNVLLTQLYKQIKTNKFKEAQDVKRVYLT